MPGAFDRGRVVADWHAFVRALRAAGYDIPWVRALEWHPLGHGLHVHAGFGRFVPIQLVERLWGHGHVDVIKMRSRRGGREDARLAAVYLAKYAGKASVADVGEHSYEVAQGFAPSVVEAEYAALPELVDLMNRHLGDPVYRWSSADEPDWRGPPARYMAW
jgi:hypothetical protein